MRRANHGLQSRNGPWLDRFRLAALAWAVIVAWLAFRPSTGLDVGLPWDKANHAMAFVVLTLLTGAGWPRWPWSRLLLLMMGAGVGIELVQGLPLIGRDADVRDVVADAVGIGAGLAALAMLRRSGAAVRE